MQENAVIEAANLQDIYPLERLEGRERAQYPAQEVRGYGPYVLRIEPNSPALAAEARVLRILPGSIPHAAVIASGDGWLVQRRVAGEPLSAFCLRSTTSNVTSVVPGLWTSRSVLQLAPFIPEAWAEAGT